MVLLAEPDAERCEQASVDAAWCLMSAANFFEAAMVVKSREGAAIGQNLYHLMKRN